jgi:hypothetical protein
MVGTIEQAVEKAKSIGGGDEPEPEGDEAEQPEEPVAA